MAAVKVMYVRFSKGSFMKTDALSALKCAFYTFKFDVICPENSSFWGSVALYPCKILRLRDAHNPKKAPYCAGYHRQGSQPIPYVVIS